MSTMYHLVKHDSMQWHAVATRLSISFAYACSPVGSASTKLVPILLRLLRRALRATPSGGCRRAAPFVVALPRPQPHVPQSARGASSAVAPRDPVGALLSRIWASRRRNSFGIGACSWSSVPAAAHISHSRCDRITMIVANIPCRTLLLDASVFLMLLSSSPFGFLPFMSSATSISQNLTLATPGGSEIPRFPRKHCQIFDFF